LLPAGEADDRTVFADLCALLVAIRDGLPELPDLD
jgi:hypothetical protein